MEGSSTNVEMKLSILELTGVTVLSLLEKLGMKLIYFVFTLFPG